jgi:hypothetical protein
MYASEWIKIRQSNDWHSFPITEDFKLLKYELQELQQMNALQIIKEEELEEQNQVQLAQMQEWETSEFIYQQTRWTFIYPS